MSAPAAPAAAGAQASSSPTYRWTAAAIIASGSLASILSSTVVNVAVPTLEKVLGASLLEVQWLSTGYLLGLAAVIPISGWVSDRVGTKLTYLSTLAVFLLASFLCGFGRTIGVEIIFRVLQGLAGGMVMPVGMTMLMHITPPAERGRMMGIIGIPMLLGPAIGPAVAGWLLEHLGWEYIFWVNIPFCLIALALAIPLLRDAPRHPVGKLDVVGLLLVTPGVTIFLYGVTQAATYGFGSFSALGPIAAGLALTAVFGIWELRQTAPLLELGVFRDPAYSAAIAVNLLLTMALFSATFVVPVYLQQFQGYDAVGAGAIVAFQGIGAAVSLPIAGWLTDRYGARTPVVFGICLLTIVGFRLSLVNNATSNLAWAILLCGRGVAMGFCMMPAMSSAYVTIAPRLVSRATALANTAQRMLSSVAIAAAASVLAARLVARTPHTPPAAVSAHLHLLTKLAVGRGFDDTLALLAGASALALPAAMRLRRPLPGGHEDEHPPQPAAVYVMTAVLTVVALAIFAFGVLLCYM